MSLQLFKTPATRVADENNENVFLSVNEALDTGREVNLKSHNSPAVTTPTRAPFAEVQRQPTAQPTQSLEQSLKTVKRLREQENALSSKVIQNLQADKAALAAKMEVLQGLLSAANARCTQLEGSARDLEATKEQQTAAIAELREELQQQRDREQEANQTIADREHEVKLLQAQVTTPEDAQLIKLTKRYLKGALDVQEARKVQFELAKRADSQIESIANCQRCDKKFGTFTWRYQCRRCAKAFCGLCTVTGPDFTHERGVPEQESSNLSAFLGMNAPRQRSCRECFKLQEEADTKRQKLQHTAEVELRALEEWSSQVQFHLEDSDRAEE